MADSAWAQESPRQASTQALQALALAATGADPEAVATLAEALRLAYRQGHVRVFADEGARWGRCSASWSPPRGPGCRPPARSPSTTSAGCAGLRRRPRRPPAPRAGGRGRAGPGRAAHRPRARGAPAAGRGPSNRDVAQELVVTLDTVKKHVSHVLDKLGAADRTEAVARARQLGLLR